MTVRYNPARRLWLHHVRGTVLPSVWLICFLTTTTAFILCHVYDPLRRAVRDGQKKTVLFYVFQDCDAFFGLITTFVTFILTFFNSTIFGRWWRLRELCGVVNGKTVDTCVMLSTYVTDEAELREVLRYLWLAHALHVYSVEVGLTADQAIATLTKRGLLTAGIETEALRGSSFASSTPVSIAYGWFLSRIAHHTLEEYVPEAMRATVFKHVQLNVSAMRGAAADVLMYMSTPVPLAYTHLLELTVTIYVVIAPFGLTPRLLWMAVPGCFIVTLVFYGFMALGKQMINPFARRAGDSFDTFDFLRGTQQACLDASGAIGAFTRHGAKTGWAPLGVEVGEWSPGVHPCSPYVGRGPSPPPGKSANPFNRGANGLPALWLDGLRHRRPAEGDAAGSKGELGKELNGPDGQTRASDSSEGTTGLRRRGQPTSGSLSKSLLRDDDATRDDSSGMGAKPPSLFSGI